MKFCRWLLCLFIACSSSGLRAQIAPLDTNAVLPHYAILLPYQTIWQNSGNAAGLSKDSVLLFGNATLHYQHVKGNYKMAQQAATDRQLMFETARLMQVGKSLFYGRFSYTQQWEDQVRLNNVLNPYRGTPYLWADSIGGNWKKQHYVLAVKASTPALLNDRLLLGIGADLQVATGARQNDPRPLATNNQIKIAPGLLWNVSQKNTLGLNGIYERYQEDISMETKNTTINHRIYRFLGMGQLELPTTFVTSASRIYAGQWFGAQIQYQFKNNNLSWWNDLSFKTGDEQVSEGSSIPRKSGTWKQAEYAFASSLNLKQALSLHRFDVALRRIKDTGVEFHEIYDPSTRSWQTILEADFYIANTDVAQATYAYIRQNNAYDFNWLTEAGINYLRVDKHYLLPLSTQEISTAEIWARGLKNIPLGHHSLHVGLQLSYSKNLKQSLHFVPITADRTLVANEVLYPDHGYLSNDFLASAANIQYNFKIHKAKGTHFFIRSAYTRQQNIHAPIYGSADGQRHFFRLAFGAFY